LSKEDQGKKLLFPCICLFFFGGIGAFQRVMTNPNDFFLARLGGGSLCAAGLAILVASAREPLSMLSFMRDHSTSDSGFQEEIAEKF
jgi:hypothetical protein